LCIRKEVVERRKRESPFHLLFMKREEEEI